MKHQPQLPCSLKVITTLSTPPPLTSNSSYPSTRNAVGEKSFPRAKRQKEKKEENQRINSSSGVGKRAGTCQTENPDSAACIAWHACTSATPEQTTGLALRCIADLMHFRQYHISSFFFSDAVISLSLVSRC